MYMIPDILQQIQVFLHQCQPEVHWPTVWALRVPVNCLTDRQLITSCSILVHDDIPREHKFLVKLHKIQKKSRQELLLSSSSKIITTYYLLNCGSYLTTLIHSGVSHLFFKDVFKISGIWSNKQNTLCGLECEYEQGECGLWSCFQALASVTPSRGPEFFLSCIL